MHGALLDANLPDASYPSQPRPFTQETTFGNLAQLLRIDTAQDVQCQSSPISRFLRRTQALIRRSEMIAMNATHSPATMPRPVSALVSAM